MTAETGMNLSEPQMHLAHISRFRREKSVRGVVYGSGASRLGSMPRGGWDMENAGGNCEKRPFL